MSSSQSHSFVLPVILVSALGIAVTARGDALPEEDELLSSQDAGASVDSALMEAPAGPNAAFTTTNPDVDGTGHCRNGNEGVNCNIYDGKEYVWLSGGPSAGEGGLPDGTYVFAVLVPGGQGGDDNPNDGTPNNLSDVAPTSGSGAGDDWTNRVFSMSDGVLSHTGTHDVSNNKIRLMGYDDTTNRGGEYILAICSLANRDLEAPQPPGVDPSGCKYDAFKIMPRGGLRVTVTDPINYDETFAWTVAKEADRTLLQQSDPNATVNYTVTVAHDEGTTSHWVLTGSVLIESESDVDVTADVTITVGPGSWVCMPANTTVGVPANGSTAVEYLCDYAEEGTPPAGDVTATVTWTEEGEPRTLVVTDPLDLAGALATQIDPCVTVTDSRAGPLGVVCVGDPNPTLLTYTSEVHGEPGTCTDVDNTATFTTIDLEKTGSASVTVELCVGADLTVTKTAIPSFTRQYLWSVDKSAEPPLVKKVGGTATFVYMVEARQEGSEDRDWVVAGDITVANPNDWQSITVDVLDTIDGGGLCTVFGGTGVLIEALRSVTLPYECIFDGSTSGTNTATATWNSAAAFTPNGSASGTAPYAFSTPTELVHHTIEVTDSFAGSLGTLTATDASPYAAATFTYERTVAVPTWDCVTYDNTALIEETGQEDSASVEVCGPHRSGALTMGFWQNKNGQAIIAGGSSTGGVCTSGTWLRQFAPYANLSSTATCAQVASYVTGVIKAASAAGSSMNAMLKAQMLATALDVYFSDPSLGGNRIGAPSAIGSMEVDLTAICTDMQCASFEDTSAAFGGASALTVVELLTSAAGQSNPGGSVWYGNVKSIQELAKDTFDAVNNQKVFLP